MSLIKLLSEAYAKSQDPDAIVVQLKNRGWIKPSQLSRENFDRDKETVSYCYCQVYHDGYRGMTSFNGGWRMNHCTNSYDQFVRTLETSESTYWVIPFDQYKEGSLPPCSTS